MARTIVTTGDGSHSLFWPEYDEHYHSTHGALQESQHVFLRMGWDRIVEGKTEIAILEMGFGTGLNALLTSLEATKTGIHVNYTTLEKFPVTQEEAAGLNYPQLFPDTENAAQIYKTLHEVPWGAYHTITPEFSIRKLAIDLADLNKENEFDLVYFDAFAPNSQPELWTATAFEKVYRACKPGAIMTTYCAQGEARRAMKTAGFTVERIPGPPGKREMMRATRP